MVSITKTATTALTTAIVAAGLWLLPPSEAQAADIRLLTFLSSRPVLEEAVPVFQKASGHKVCPPQVGPAQHGIAQDSPKEVGPSQLGFD